MIINLTTSKLMVPPPFKALPKLLIFAKTPLKGKVKTRLIAQYGAEKALQFYLLMVQHIMTESLHCDASVEIWCTPTTTHPVLQKWQQNQHVSLFQQKGRDLGERMAYATAHAFTEQQTKLIIIGCDCPKITSHLIQKAFNLLQTYDVIIQPAEDGGYVMLGMNQYYPELFEKISWGTHIVYAETIKKLIKLGVSWFSLDMSWDIDHPKDVRRWLDMR